MAIDTSIYQNIQPVQPSLQSPLDVAYKAQSLAGLGLQQNQMRLQQQQMQYQMGLQQALRQAYANNTDQNGNVNRAGVMADLGKMGLGAQAGELNQQWAAQDKAQAEAKSAQMAAHASMVQQVFPAMEHLAGMDEDSRAKSYNNIMKSLESEGVDSSGALKDQNGNFIYDPQRFQNAWSYWKNSKAALDQLTQQAQVANTQADTGLKNAETAAKYADVKLLPAKLNSEMFGRGSANTALANQYNNEMAPVRNSQLFMNQMIDSYQNKTPQGDAALVLNNFKIRNPQAVDINSIEEMKNSQAVSDKYKNQLSQALSGGFDDNTRKNLLRDGISAYRANYETGQEIRNRYQDRASQSRTPLAGMTDEPGLDKTYSKITKLQNDLGPYVPPTDRPGIMGSISNIASKIAGIGSANNASASTGNLPPPPNGTIWMQAPGGKIKAVPLSKKGDAIAAGGSVVK